MCMNPAPPERGTRRDPAQRGGATLSMTRFLFCLSFAVTLARAAWAAAALALLAFWLWAQRSTLNLDEETLIRLGRAAPTSVLLSFFAGAGFALAIFHGSGHAVPTSARGAQAIAGAAVLLNVVV